MGNNTKLLEEYTSLKKQLSEKVLEVIHDLAQEHVFSINQDAQSVAFNMYTPSFNDVEPCENTIGEVVALKLNEALLGEYDVSDLFGIYYRDDEPEGDRITVPGAADAFGRRLSDIEDILLAGLGTNVAVVITRNGKYFKEEYDCGF